MADNTEQTRIDALSGGAPLPQAAAATMAARLLGPDLAERYGDVLGTRPTSFKDVARDFAVGAAGGQEKVDALKMRVVDNYRRELAQTEQDTRQKEADARQQLSDFFALLAKGKQVPRELRQDFFKEGLTKIGVEPTSPLFMKVLSNYEKFGSIYDSLSDPEVQRLADGDPITFAEKLVEMGHDGANAIALAKDVQAMRQSRAVTAKIFSQASRLGIQQQDANDKARAAWKLKMAGQPIKDRLGRTRVLSPEELDAMANRYYPPTGSSAPPASPAPELVGIPQGGATSVTTTPTTTGAASSAPAPAASAAGIPQRQLAGSVTRVE